MASAAAANPEKLLTSAMRPVGGGGRLFPVKGEAGIYIVHFDHFPEVKFGHFHKATRYECRHDWTITYSIRTVLNCVDRINP